MKFNSVVTNIQQDFTAPEKALGRSNIGAASQEDLVSVSAAIPDLAGYATESYVDEAVSSVTALFPEEQELVAGDNVSITVSGSSAIISASGGASYSAGQYVSISGDTISVTGLQPAGSYALESELQIVSAAIPSLSGYATESYVNSAYTAGSYISVNGGVIAVTGLQPPDIYADYQIPQEEAMVFSLTAEDIAASGRIIDFQFREAPATNVILGNAMVSLVWWINYTGGVAKNIVDKIYFILRNTQSGSYTWNCITCSDVKDSQWDKDWNCIDSSHLRVKYNQLRVNIALKPEAQVGDTFQFLLGGFVKDIRA